MSTPTNNDLRDTIRKLKATGQDGFEGLMAKVLTDITKRSFALASSGSQRGKDGQSALDGGAIEEKVIDLLMRVTRVSVETMEIVEAMKSEKR
jgi:hypothetical protein